MLRKSNFKNGPIIKIIQIALEVWIRNQCESVDKIKLEISGTALELLSGKISGVKLKSYKVNYKNIPLSKVELKSGPIKIEVDLSSRNQKINLQNIFKIEGNVSIDSKGLNAIINSKNWSWIGDSISEKLLGVDQLKNIKIVNEMLELHSLRKGVENPIIDMIEIEAFSGTLRFKHKDSLKTFLLKMDPSINIEAAKIKRGELQIDIVSKVNP